MVLYIHEQEKNKSANNVCLSDLQMTEKQSLKKRSVMEWWRRLDLLFSFKHSEQVVPWPHIYCNHLPESLYLSASVICQRIDKHQFTLSLLLRSSRERRQEKGRGPSINKDRSSLRQGSVNTQIQMVHLTYARHTQVYSTHTCLSKREVRITCPGNGKEFIDKRCWAGKEDFFPSCMHKWWSGS